MMLLDDNGAERKSPWPVEIRLSKDKCHLSIRFDDGFKTDLVAELLRVESPSAEVQGHGVGQKITPSGKRNVKIEHIEPVGNYAIRLKFNDGHDTGIFSWSTLYDYSIRQDALMKNYIARLLSSGESRD
mgnify:CR=1 FL=1|tara:strand:- start:15 stop:401 length:387 start_codon:yes stop_codon:yes gene_type:complete